jgi:predicted DNA binding CopG/RHH family protein
MPKKVPVLKTDEEAEAFLLQDLSDLDFSEFKPLSDVLDEVETELSLRLPQSLADAARRRAKALGIPYTRYIRLLIEHDVSAR